MIAECAADLLAKVQAVMDGKGGAGAALAIGGNEQDPGLLKIPLPAALIALQRDQVDERDYGHGHESGLPISAQPMMLTFSVVVFIEYTSDDDMLEVQLPLLEEITEAVHATAIDGATDPGFRWRYVGQQIGRPYPNRFTYEQRYTLNYVTNS